jgi:hypothetical protein
MEITAGHGVAHGVNGAHVGLNWENGVPGKWRLRSQDPGLRPDSVITPEGALRLILAWARPLCASSHAVSFRTTRRWCL